MPGNGVWRIGVFTQLSAPAPIGRSAYRLSVCPGYHRDHDVGIFALNGAAIIGHRQIIAGKPVCAPIKPTVFSNVSTVLR